MIDEDLRDIRESELFDPMWYSRTYLDVGAVDDDPAAHYLTIGTVLNRNPSPRFHVGEYLRLYPDVAKSGMNPLLHYIRYGASEGRELTSVSSVIDKLCILNADGAVAEKRWEVALTQWSRVAQTTENEGLRGRARVGSSILRRLIHLQEFKERLIQYRRRSTPYSANTEPKVVVYSAIVGGYDSLKIPEFLDPRISYVLFTDSPAIESGAWQIKSIPFHHEDNTRIARFVKTHPHKLLENWDIAIWLDSNVMIVDDIYPIIESFLDSGCAVGAVPHPERSSVYEEMKACSQYAKDETSIMQRQVERYRDLGFNHSDLIESNLMIFDLREPNVFEFLDTWWSEIDKYSRRDQLSLNYALITHGMDWYRITERPQSLRNHHAFAFGSHGLHDDGLVDVLNEALQLPEVDPRRPGRQKKAPTATPQELKDTRIVQFTPAVTGNPYYTMIPKELSDLGYSVEFSTDFDTVRIRENEKSVIVNIHQLEPFYHKANLELTHVAAKEFLQTLEEIADAGVKIVLFWHNPYPHDRKFIAIDSWLYERVGALCSGVIVLLNAARTFVENFVDRSKIFYLPHPSFNTIYGEMSNRVEARQKLGIGEEVFVFLSLGQIKPYKGHEFLLQAWKESRDIHGSGGSILIVAGQVHDQALADLLAAEKDVVFFPGFVEDSDMMTYLAAADVSVFTHKDIWTSGGAILAMGYGLPVIMPGTRYTREYVRHDDNGFLYLPGNVQDCARVIVEAINCRYLDHISFMNTHNAIDNDSKTAAENLVKIYSKLV